MQLAASSLRRRLAAGALFISLAAACAASVSTGSASAAGKGCDTQVHASRFIALRAFQRDMKPARAAYFRGHHNARARRAFALRQESRLAALRRALIRCAPADNSAKAVDPPPTPCSPTLQAARDSEMNEGILNSRLSLRASGTLPAVMLFVDFPNLHATESSSRLYEKMAPNSRTWFNQVSGGRVDLQITPVLHWYRMPRGSRDYGLDNGLTFEEQWHYIADAVAAADADVDFSPFKIIYVVAAKGSPLERSPAFHAFAGSGIPVDGTELRYGSTFGEDVRDVSPGYPSYVLIHETGHIIGLPDLYDVPTPNYWGLLRFAGGWDIMSWNYPGPEFLAWHKWKLGWLEPSQLTCLNEPGELKVTLTPGGRPGGLKAVVVPTSASSAYVVEARRRTGEDARICTEGVLVYSVDAGVRSGYGPVRVRPSERDTSSDLVWRCGPLYAAPFATGRGRVARFEDAEAGVTVRVLGSTAAGYRVLVSRTSQIGVSSIRRAVPPGGDGDEEAGSAPPTYFGLASFLGGWTFLSDKPLIAA